uniref:NTF2 domain-containing protein n=1 Tax=Peromyscus maniculatus bairdii TaxID=230844 RepID=A0A8C8UKQ3_PERMB
MSRHKHEAKPIQTPEKNRVPRCGPKPSTDKQYTKDSKEKAIEKQKHTLVGTEFKRKQKTQINKPPEHQQRSNGRKYNNMQGRGEHTGKPHEPLYAQKDIHHKVLSLNFSECHTKIRHVDAHATLSDGVVVQVMGLLSNSGQPERKFMQTFVLDTEHFQCFSELIDNLILSPSMLRVLLYINT